jgi:DNA-binding transcriptional MerR regulator
VAERYWKVGELAERTGLTVRALHHYDAIGLVRPGARSASGHRLYTAGDLERLQRLLSLRQLGLSLDEVRACLDRPGYSLAEVLRLHAGRLRERLARESALLGRLEGLVRLLDTAADPSPEQILRTIEAMTMIEAYYTPEQLDQLRRRGEALGEEAIREVEAEWPRLMAAMKAEMEAGTDPAGPRVQALAARWRELVEMFTGGDPGLGQAVGKLWQERGPETASAHGMDFDRGLFEYVGKAHEAAKAGG